MNAPGTCLTLFLSVLLPTNLLATGAARTRVTDASAIAPSITVSGAVGSNPATVYTSGQASQTVSVAWNAGTDYSYCEVYFTVNDADQKELGRGHDGANPITVTAGNAYRLWMVVYPGGGQVNVVTELRLVAEQQIEAALPPPPPPSGGGSTPAGSVDAVNDRPSVLTAAAFRNAPFISDVRVQPDSRNVIISFASTQSTPPLIEISKVAPASDRFGIIAFPFNSGAFSRFAPEQKGRFTLDVDVLGEQLDIGSTYYYIINVFNNNRNDTKRPREQVTGQFNTLAQTVKVVWERIHLWDDSDDFSTGEGLFWFWANYRQPTQQYALYPNRDFDSGEDYSINQTVVIENAPDALKLEASGWDEDGDTLKIVGGSAPHPLSGAGDHSISGTGEYDTNATSQEFDLSKFPGNNRTVPFRMETRGGSLKFVVFGHFEITRGAGEQVGTTSSALTTAPPPEPVRPQARVKVTPANAGPLLSVCDLARQARARNSPAAPSLEERCRAAGASGEIAPVKPQARVKLDPSAPAAPPRAICDRARLFRARNSPAAPNLEESCRAELAATGLAIAQLDATVAAARTAEADNLYRQGFDIATAIFGDPALGAWGRTETGPGSLGIRDKLTPAGQRGFNASVKFHLSRKY